MPTDHRNRLANIRRFDQLVIYLRDTLGWPIESDDFEELTFEYTPEELGIDVKSAAKIQEIKRLRPLEARQPWGIFFVKFEPKRLPVVALRRILSQVALKKRASANKSERQAWAANDLLFISSYGEVGDDRCIAFAHFCKPTAGEDLPTLKVLGWDNLDTPLHLDAVAHSLTEHLTWPEKDDPELWRERWRAAFTLRHRQVITTSKELSIRLAELARAIRKRIKTTLAMETARGPLTQLMKAFQTALVHDIDADGFADMYAQTIAYGLLSARITDPHKKTVDDLTAQMRTNSFLRELMETFLKVGGRQGKTGGPGIDFDELGVSEVVELLDDANMEAVIRDFGDQNPQEDPVIHFYELFIKEYDAKKRTQRGVFYTPRPIVSYIVRSVDELLRSEFGLTEGLADTTSWREITKRRKDLKIPKGVSPDQDFIQILDPATGTGTFLVEVIDLIYKTLIAKWKARGHSEKKIDELWNKYVPKHLLTRLYGYELLMAPYTIAHLKIGLKLFETGYRFVRDERAQVYLTNTLEPPGDGQLVFDFLPALADEVQAVNKVKKQKCFTVVVGNPPYAKSSSNRDGSAEALVEQFKAAVRSERNIQPLSDDYVKFLGHMLVASYRVPLFAFGMITNRGYLNGLIHRGMRHVLFDSFDGFWAIDLHGDSNVGEKPPKGLANENVFDIQQGVAISIGCKGASIRSTLKRIDCWGTRNDKYMQLSSLIFASKKWVHCSPQHPHYFFSPSGESKMNFEAHFPLIEVMPTTNTGIKTHRDELVIDFDKDILLRRIHNFVDSTRSNEDIRATFFGIDAGGKYKPGDNRDWSMVQARRVLQTEKRPLSTFASRIDYRPFDSRFIFFHSAAIDFGREDLMEHMKLDHNLGLITTRQVPNCDFCHVFVTRCFIEMKTCSHDRGTNLFPLYLKAKPGNLNLGTSSRLNFSQKFLNDLAAALRLSQSNLDGLPIGTSPEDIFYYIYAVFHSLGYRTRYKEFLRIDFPRLPLPDSLELFRALTQLGGELVKLHLLESTKLDHFIAEYIGGRTAEVQKVSWSDGNVWLDKTQTTGFKGVQEEIWNFHIGGYQVCNKWLKDRKGRTLSKDEIVHYQRIVVAISETIRLMKQIDEVIEQHGGWPGAFHNQHTSAP